MSGATSDTYPHHRANVGIALFNSDGAVWLGRRDSTPGPWNWQLPQGGIDAGEDARAAALRELQEETGISPDLVSYLDEIKDWLAYDYPPEVREDPRFHKKRHLGQKQRWFAFRFDGNDNDIDLQVHAEVEFDAWRWGRLSEIPDLIIPWKRDVYVEVAKRFEDFATP
ncbi:RNA pyrophosphohydrolase [Maricaulis maris]|uniref:RNA pyrophosphohydrolase n=1 Tax=Maricaulis maris TaxID=74318 RepID=A0A495D3T8_9PROT|nr:RNA pyrophosphohydrolase [Maricaulis maris]RKQ96566.1 putative (di)nucleoside polyphosphate hydrolase [Maricaulis maris]